MYLYEKKKRHVTDDFGRDRSITSKEVQKLGKNKKRKIYLLRYKKK